MDDDWILYSVTSFAFAVIFLFCYIRHVFTFFERNKIPRASYPTFPFGNVYDVILQRTPMFVQLWKFYNRFKRKKCAIGGFYIFLKPAVLMTSPSETYLSPDKDYFVNEVESDDLNPEIREELLDAISKKVPAVWRRLLSQLKENEQEVNLSHLMIHEFADVAIKQFFDLKTAQGSQEVQVLENEHIFSVGRKIFSLSYPTFNSFFQKFEKTKRLHVILEKIVENRTEQSVNKDDLIQILVQNGCPSEEIKKIVSSILHNLNKCNNLLLFTLYELCVNKDIQEEVREEILRFRKANSSTSHSDLNKLSYLETVVCETLRKYPLEPFFYKICKRDYSQNEVTLNNGMLVFISTFGIHHDVHNYVNPEQFDPDRFSEENIHFIDSRKYLPFGSKNERGFDVQYVRMMMKLALIELLATFKFSLCKKSPKTIQFDETPYKSLKFKEHVWLKMHRL